MCFGGILSLTLGTDNKACGLRTASVNRLCLNIAFASEWAKGSSSTCSHMFAACLTGVLYNTLSVGMTLLTVLLRSQWPQILIVALCGVVQMSC